ncbi:glycoside hydrolase family 99-like domain-containing protein, partial [Paenibacillus sepulcri]|nr:glycoside hydrolase family 99-like domain-containing protein [Paenibacillus sepulcri]
DMFRTRVREAGLGELHLNAIVWAVPNLPSEQKVENLNDLINRLGFDSATSYVWIHHNQIPEFPAYSYAKYCEMSVRDFDTFTNKFDLPYFPNVTMGWDSSPRTIQTDRFDHLGYPFTPILTGNTPEEFRLALKQAKAFLDEGITNPKILTINSWNEWTEGSYLEPDTKYGMAYLEAIRDVFGQ